MDENICFSVLEIEKTKEKQVIRDAYRRLLVKTNPEDDPEGFKRLREAYEAANAYADQPEILQKAPETPLEQWMEKVKEVYASLSRRLNPECWKALLEDELCLSLDTSVEARDALLGFLAENYRIKTDIWKMIDRTFNLQEEEKELREQFHPNYIDFIMNQCRSEDDFPYELLEGEDQADYDTFLYHYYELCRQNESRDTEAASHTLETLEHFPITHPYLLLERARYGRNLGQTEQASGASHELLKSMAQDIRVLVYSGEIFWDNDEKDAAAECFGKVLQAYPGHYMANKYLALYFYEKAEFEKAKDYCVEALRISAHEEALLDCMRSINQELMKLYESRMQAGEASEDDMMELGWCYLQNEQGVKGVELLEGRTVSARYCAEYHNLLAKCYFVENRFADAAKEARACIPAIEVEAEAREAEAKEKEKGNQKEKIPGRIAAACEIVAKSLHMLAKREGLLKEEQASCYTQALDAIEEALKQEPGNRGYRIEKAQIFMDRGDYPRASDVCDEMLEADQGDFFACIIRQKCCFEMQDGQGVIDNFYQAKDIYAGFPDMYELAAEVFIRYNQYEDATGILDQAKEANVSSPKLDLLRLTILRETAKEDAEFQKAYHLAEELFLKFSEHMEQVTREHEAELNYEMARCCRSLNRNQEALHYIEKACELQEDKLYRWIRGNTLFELKDYQRAMEDYQFCEQAYGDNEVVYENIGRCWLNLGDWEKAADYYQKALRWNPNHINLNGRITDIYKEQLKRTGNRMYYQKALPFASRQIELDPCAYYYIERGLLYLEAGMWKEAEEDFVKAEELEPENPYAYNDHGCIYLYTKRYKEAMKFFLKSIEVRKEKDSIKAYTNMAECYERMGDFGNAVIWYQKVIKLFPDDRNLRRGLMNIYKRMGDWKEAQSISWSLYGEMKGPFFHVRDARHFLENGDLMLMEKHPGTALWRYRQALHKGGVDAEACTKIGNVYLYYKNRPAKALEMYRRALKATEDTSSDYPVYCRNIMECYYEMGKPEEAKPYQERAFQSIRKIYGSLENYLQNCYYRPLRYYEAGALHFYAGDTEKAREYFEQMMCDGMCRSCTYQECEDYWEAMGFLKETEGELEEALSCYELACKYQKDNHLSISKVKKLRKKLRKR